MSQEETKILKELKAQVAKQVPPQFRQKVAEQIDARAAQALKEERAQTEGLSPMPGRVMAMKETPSDKEIRRRHVGVEALSLIARRAIVGIARLRESKQLVIYDTAPLPNAEYMLTTLSLLKNPDGTADLLVTEISSEVLVAADYIIHNTETEIGPSDPKLSIDNVAKYMFIQNQGTNPIYISADGEYDPVTKKTIKNTSPASGIGLLMTGSGTLDISHAMKANPRLISPSGDQTVNVIISR